MYLSIRFWILAQSDVEKSAWLLIMFVVHLRDLVQNLSRTSLEPPEETDIHQWLKTMLSRGVMVTVNRSSERVREPGWLFCQWLIHSAFQLCCDGVMQMPLCCAAGVSSQSSGDECMLNMSCECQVCHYLRVTDEMEHFKLLASQLGSPTAFNKNMCFNW